VNFRDAVVAGTVALAATGMFAMPATDRLDGLSIDVLHWLEQRVLGPRRAADRSPVAVIAIDEATYRTEPFRDVPKVLWTREIATVVNAVVAAGATVIGFDVILPTSAEKFVPGIDREFLVALRGAARENRVVLGKVQHSESPVAPFAGQSFAVGHGRNIRVLNLHEDDDGVVRRVPAFFDIEGPDGNRRQEPSFSLEIAGRHLGQTPVMEGSGSVRIGDSRIPMSGDNAFALHFDTLPGSVPTHSFADLYACAAEGRADYFASAFRGKAVVLGVVLDVEDRKLTSYRFARVRDGTDAPPRCAGGQQAEAAFPRDSVPGVHVQATAVANFINGDALRVPGTGASSAVTFGFTATIAVLAMLLRPAIGGMAGAAMLLAWTVAALILFRTGTVLPLLDPAAAGSSSFAVLLGYRFAVADRDKRFLRKVFSLYLAPAVVDRLVSGETKPSLGGETRNLTVLFSDLEKFTALSERLSAEDLVAFLNRYLSEMTDIVEAHGGFVDKYIGDAIVAVFGAPVDDPEHARHAVSAALACRARVDVLSREMPVPEGAVLNARIGINTGPMLVGNIGSRRRFNYTVMGDAVNLAARLEGANKPYGTRILVSESTAAACGDGILFREIDSIGVVGRTQPLNIFEPLAPREAVQPADHQLGMAYASALAAYRQGRFMDAASDFADLSTRFGDPVSAMMADRARAFALEPPPAPWDGVYRLEGK
jgi:adenylate cyclase